MQRFCRVWIVLFLWLIPAHPAEARSPASIIAFDQLSRSDRPVRLTVRLVTGGLALIRRPISGERIEFRLNDRSLGRTLTGGDGLAALNFAPQKPGLYLISVLLMNNPRYEAEPVELIVAYRAAADSILLVHLSSTKTPSDPPQIPFSPAPSSEPMPEASGVLTELSHRHQIVYLETGDEGLLSESKSWLIRQAFPQAPLYVWRSPGDPAGRTERLIERLDEIKDQGFKNIAAGITRSPADAEGLLKAKIKTIVITEEDDGLELPEGTQKVTDWNSIPVLVK